MELSNEYYLHGAKIPKIFLEADKVMNEANPEPKTIDEPIEVPMPFIHGTKGTKGPILITENWYVKAEKKNLAKIAKDQKMTQIEMMQLIAERDRLRYKLGQLDPGKKKDSKMIVTINVKLKDIEVELDSLQKISGINLNKLDNGTKLGQFIGKCKRVFKKVRKKIKKWYRYNEDLIKGLAAILAPIVVGIVAKKLIPMLLV